MIELYIKLITIEIDNIPKTIAQFQIDIKARVNLLAIIRVIKKNNIATATFIANKTANNILP